MSRANCAEMFDWGSDRISCNSATDSSSRRNNSSNRTRVESETKLNDCNKDSKARPSYQDIGLQQPTPCAVLWKRK